MEPMEASGYSDEENNNPMLLRTTQQRKMCYRQLLNRVEGIQETEDVSITTIKEIGRIISQVNSIEQEHNIENRYQFPEETLLDHMVLSSAGNVLLQCIESVDVNMATYDPAQFAEKIISICTGDEDGFEDIMLEKLTQDANNIIPQMPNYSFVFGTYDLQNLPKAKQRVERQRAPKDKFVRKEPEKVVVTESDERGIEETVKILFNVLKNSYERNSKNPIKYFDYVIDTNSFSNTIENMFYTSFLVRDGRAQIGLDKNQQPYIAPMSKMDLITCRDDGGVNSQIIAGMTMSEWESYKKNGFIQVHKEHVQ